jgi:hypothetical protein
VEREHTTEVIPEAEAIEDPVERLRSVFRTVYEQPVDRTEVALAAAGDDPLVAPALARVVRARVAFLRAIFSELGLRHDDAAARVWLAYRAQAPREHLREARRPHAHRRGRVPARLGLT